MLPFFAAFLHGNGMVGLAHHCLVRTGVTMWRLRRQVFGAIFIAIALCLFYFQFAADESLSSNRQDTPLRRDLNSLGHKTFQDPFVSDDSHVKSKHNHVKFVANTQDQLEEQQRMLGKKKDSEEPPVVMVAPAAPFEQSDYGRADRLNSVPSANKGAIQQAIDQLNDAPRDSIQQFTAPPQGNAMMSMDDGFGSPWGGNYKYNPYGEPVYGKTNRPNFIPKERVVHFDLKGAPPEMAVLKSLIPWIASHGATMVLLEYEEMFPFHGILADITARNHYTPTQIRELLDLCDKHKIEVIPLVQTFGHLEFTLKLQKFSHLREVPELPQAICPSRNESVNLVYELINQVMHLHTNSRYLHIGCDEVFHMGECEICRQNTRDNIFLKHVSTVAKYVKNKFGAQVLIWDDMLRHVSDVAMRDFNIGELVEPMVWVYAEDIYRFMPPSTWTKFSQIFSHVWAASAFKGAFGEQLTVPNVRRHLDNHMNWLDVMATENAKFSGGFRGLVLTGWQRYDHFAVLCELLPAAMPSLAVNLISVSHGYFNSSLQSEIYTALSCVQTPKYQSWINLDTDPFLWDKFSWCFFPGKPVFTMTSRLDSVRREVDSYVEKVTRSRAWISDYNRRHNFSSPMRIDEDLEEMPSKLHSVTTLIKTAKEALTEWYDEWTVGEWIEQHLWPLLSKLETIQKESETMKKFKFWPVRPLPLLPQLAQYGVSEPTSSGNSLNEIGKSFPKHLLAT